MAITDTIPGMKRELKFFPVRSALPRKLARGQIQQFNEKGYIFPLDVFAGDLQNSPCRPLTPSKGVTAWLAIDSADEENGAMQVLPGLTDTGRFPLNTVRRNKTVSLASRCIIRKIMESYLSLLSCKQAKFRCTWISFCMNRCEHPESPSLRVDAPLSPARRAWKVLGSTVQVLFVVAGTVKAIGAIFTRFAGDAYRPTDLGFLITFPDGLLLRTMMP